MGNVEGVGFTVLGTASHLRLAGGTLAAETLKQVAGRGRVRGAVGRFWSQQLSLQLLERQSALQERMI